MKKSFLNFLIILVDIFVLSLLYYITLILNDATIGMDYKDFMFVIFTILSLLYYENIYTLRYDFWQETYKILKTLLLAYLIILALLTLLNSSLEYSKSFITLYFLLAMVMLPTAKRFIKRVLYKSPFFREKVLLIGSKAQTDILREEFRKNWYLGLESSKKDYDMVIISSELMTLEDINKEIQHYLEKNSSVYVIPYVTTINFVHSNIMEYSNIRYNTIEIENRLLSRKNRWLKNSFDFLLTLMLIPPFLILHLFITLLIKLDSKGDIFFKQLRLGKDNKNFLCYKYRTMYEDSDALLQEYLKKNPDEVIYYETYHKYKNDLRITKIGKFLRATSLDELPQIINVLRGEMSLVGPRPYMLKESEKLGNDKNFILKVRPGITGLWQVSGRNNLTFKERNELEVWYIKNWSLWVDFVILVKTLKVVFLKVGAR